MDKSVVFSLISKFTERILVKAVGFVISVLLARLLDPEIFGVVAIFTAVIAIAQTFVDSGLGTALVQNKSTEYADYSTVFYLSMFIAAICYLVMYALAPVITRYYDVPEYVFHFRFNALIVIFYSYNSIQTAKLQREMKFKQMLVCQIIIVSISGAVGVVAAYSGLGIWALIIYYVFSSFFTCVVYSFVVNWRPQFLFSLSRAKEFFDYGYKMLFSALLCSLFANLRTFIIGKQYSTADLGVYSRGEQIPSIISTSVDNSFSSVMLSAMSKIQEEKKQIRKLLKRTVSINSFINFPAMIGLAAIAPSLVLFLYTEKWIDCVPFMQFFCIAALNVSICVPCLTSIKAIGRSDIYLKLEIVRRIVMIVILVLSLLHGTLIAIAVGWVISNFIDIFIILVPTYKLTGYTLKDLIADTGLSLIMSLIMGLVVILVGELVVPLFLKLVLQLLCGIAVYAFLAVIFKTKEYRMLISFFTKH